MKIILSKITGISNQAKSSLSCQSPFWKVTANTAEGALRFTERAENTKMTFHHLQAYFLEQNTLLNRYKID